MINKRIVSYAVLGMLAVSVNARANEKMIVADNNQSDVEISIYNNDLALVRDKRKLNLQQGINVVSFAGVASAIRPETAIVSGKEIEILEQNYDYDIMNNKSIMDTFIGKEVKTVRENPQNGEMIFDKAVLVNNYRGMPILQFDYGIETNFPGRIVYQNLPKGLQIKPSLTFKLDNKTATDKVAELAYLTNGISWKADYTAKIKNDKSLDLKTWITLNNETGADFENAKVQLIAGNVNVGRKQVRYEPKMLYRANGMVANSAMANDGLLTVQGQNLADYYLYDLPNRTTIKDKQAKQVSLMKTADVQYVKEYRLYSDLYIGVGTKGGEFKKDNPQVVFKLVNDKKYNLGMPLPKGTMRFYENDKQNNLQFVGESEIKQTAVGDEAELVVGKAFDVYAKGKITKVKAISKNMSEVESKVVIYNAGDKDKKVILNQRIADNWEIISENVPSKKKDADNMQWNLNVPKKGKITVTYNVRVFHNR